VIDAGARPGRARPAVRVVPARSARRAISSCYVNTFDPDRRTSLDQRSPLSLGCSSLLRAPRPHAEFTPRASESHCAAYKATGSAWGRSSQSGPCGCPLPRASCPVIDRQSSSIAGRKQVAEPAPEPAEARSGPRPRWPQAVNRRSPADPAQRRPGQPRDPERAVADPNTDFRDKDHHRHV
jgi:hypothetical protein